MASPIFWETILLETMICSFWEFKIQLEVLNLLLLLLQLLFVWNLGNNLTKCALVTLLLFDQAIEMKKNVDLWCRTFYSNLHKSIKNQALKGDFP